MTTNDLDLERGNLFDVCARLDVSIGQQRETNAALRALRRPRQMQPVPYRVAQSGNSPAAGPLIFRMGGPDQGHLWYVRSIVAGGATPVTTAAGRADVFVSATDLRTYTSLANIGLADWRDQAPALPSIAFYGVGELPLRFNEELFVYISNSTPGQAYTVAAQVLDIEEGPIEEAWSF